MTGESEITIETIVYFEGGRKIIDVPICLNQHTSNGNVNMQIVEQCKLYCLAKNLHYQATQTINLYWQLLQTEP